jgi:tetratricopeptide (TPR) repeat protein
MLLHLMLHRAWFLALIPLAALAGCGRTRVPAPLEVARECFKQQDFSATIAACDRAVALDRREFEAYVLRGRARLALGQLQAALADFDHAIELAPSEPEAYYNRAIIHRKQGRPALAKLDELEGRRCDPLVEQAYIFASPVDDPVGRVLAKVQPSSPPVERPKAAVDVATSKRPSPPIKRKAPEAGVGLSLASAKKADKEKTKPRQADEDAPVEAGRSAAAAAGKSKAAAPDVKSLSQVAGIPAERLTAEPSAAAPDVEAASPQASEPSQPLRSVAAPRLAPSALPDARVLPQRRISTTGRVAEVSAADIAITHPTGSMARPVYIPQFRASTATGALRTPRPAATSGQRWLQYRPGMP